MTPPAVRVNTLVQENENYTVDSLSRYFVIFNLFSGVNRLTVFSNQWKYQMLNILYTIFFGGFLIYCTMNWPLSTFMDWSTTMTHCFYIVFCYVSTRKLCYFYKELNKFDKRVACEIKTTWASKKNFLYNIIINVISVLMMFSVYYYAYASEIMLLRIPLQLLQVTEMFFYGHLTSLILSRLYLINFFMESSLSNNYVKYFKKVREITNFKKYGVNKSNFEIKQLMDLYQIIANTYDLLIDAVKWTLLIIIVFDFIAALIFSYYSVLHIINNEVVWPILLSTSGIVLTDMLALLSPCVFGDLVHGEACRLRELLASRLYEDKLDKQSRGIARSLISLTGTRNLTFSLFRVLNIDVSLPFKFTGLLFTYLIILLQFQKVINPSMS